MIGKNGERFSNVWKIIVPAAVLALSAQAATLCVWTNSPYPGAPYNDWTNAAWDIQTAVNAATDGDLVLVTNGTYSITTQIRITNHVTLRSVEGWTNTVIDAGYPARSIRCLYLRASNAVVDGFTITRGRTNDGAGIYSEIGGSISDCFIVANIGTSDGGGVFLKSNGVIRSCLIVSNSAADEGGGVAAKYGALIDGCTFYTNSAGSEGGGMWAERYCIISNCWITGNWAGDLGGGIQLRRDSSLLCDSVISSNASGYMAGGVGFESATASTARNCVISRNWADGEGGGFEFFSTGVVQNCLIIENYSTYWGGGALCLDPGVIRNCTFVRNYAEGYGGGVSGGHGESVENTVFWENRAGAGGDNCYVESRNYSFSYVCSTPRLPGDGNFTADPAFVDPDNRDYRLRPASPCINRGLNSGWMSGQPDLTGNDRILYGTVDVGAYEFKTNGLLCNFAAIPNEGFAPLQVVFEGFVSQTNDAADYYQWDFNNDGLAETGGLGVAVVTNTYASCGNYAVSLLASNAAGEASSFVRTNWVRAGAGDVYVAIGAGDLFPYTNWLMAATNLNSAMDVAVDGTTVWLSNGVHRISTQVRVERGVLIRGLDTNSGSTTVHGGCPLRTNRCFYVCHSNAVLRYLTITGGQSEDGGGVFCDTGGTILNCVITSNSAGGGGGVSAYFGGRVEQCTLLTNTAYSGGGIYFRLGGVLANSVISKCVGINRASGGYLDYGGMVTGSVVSENRPYGGLEIDYGGSCLNSAIVSNSGVGLLLQYGGRAENNRILGNRSYEAAGAKVVQADFRNNWVEGNLAGSQAGGVLLSAGTAVACVVVGNFASNSAGGVYNMGGLVQNCLIARNAALGNPGWGGGVSGGNPPGRILNSTIACNIASNGGGYYTGFGASWANVILYSNSAVRSPNYTNTGSAAMGATNCCSYPPLPGPGNITNDPQFADAANSNYHLLATSPCIDSGTSLASVTEDLDGIPRPLDGNNDGTNAWDMGAYEYVHPLADSDSDWLRDSNEVAIGTSPILKDTDGDDMDDGAEVLAGTDPLDIASYLGLTAASRSGPGLIVRWSSAASRFYRLERSTNLVDDSFITKIATNIAATAPQNVYTDATAVGVGPWMYRVELE